MRIYRNEKNALKNEFELRNEAGETVMQGSQNELLFALLKMQGSADHGELDNLIYYMNHAYRIDYANHSKEKRAPGRAQLATATR